MSRHRRVKDARCQECLINQPRPGQVVCSYCQRLLDAAWTAATAKNQYIETYGLPAWEAKVQRDVNELY